METNENDNMTYQNFWDTEKAVKRGKFISFQAYLKNQEESQVHNLTLHFKELEKKNKSNPKISRTKEITKFKAELNELESKRLFKKLIQ